MTWTQTSATGTTTWIEGTAGAQTWTEVQSLTLPNWVETELALTLYTNYENILLYWDGTNSTAFDNLIWNTFEYGVQG